MIAANNPTITATRRFKKFLRPVFFYCNKFGLALCTSIEKCLLIGACHIAPSPIVGIDQQSPSIKAIVVALPPALHPFHRILGDGLLAAHIVTSIF
jgi:hypothetical protein